MCRVNLIMLYRRNDKDRMFYAKYTARSVIHRLCLANGAHVGFILKMIIMLLAPIIGSVYMYILYKYTHL